VLDPGDQSALIGYATEALARRNPGAVSVDLPSGVVARMFCRRISGDGRFADGVVHVKLVAAAVAAPEMPAPRSAMYLPGLVGSGVLWLRACREAETLYDSADWMTLEGETGVGKLALARAVHQRRNPAAPFHVLDADSASQDWLTKARRELLDGSGMLVIRHVDVLTARQMHSLASALQEARAAQQKEGQQKEGQREGGADDLRVAITLDRKHAAADLTRLLRFFQGTVELPPLRHHIEDLHELVPFFLARLSQQGRLTCSPEAMQLLLRHNWPGNTEQLWQVLKQVVQRRRAGVIMPKDLPPECWTVSRRLLSPLESIERDAIVQSLQDHDGNKVRAAEALGMSRATIYRKIHEYGIVTAIS
jgi:transcriptional regulator of aromatic amino acid metabolism